MDAEFQGFVLDDQLINRCIEHSAGKLLLDQ